MPAEVIQMGWSAYCEDCDWESAQVGYQGDAERLADFHNDKRHRDDNE